MVFIKSGNLSLILTSCPTSILQPGSPGSANRMLFLGPKIEPVPADPESQEDDPRRQTSKADGRAEYNQKRGTKDIGMQIVAPILQVIHLLLGASGLKPVPS
jgi:hypothetical protein